LTSIGQEVVRGDVGQADEVAHRRRLHRGQLGGVDRCRTGATTALDAHALAAQDLGELARGVSRRLAILREAAREGQCAQRPADF
jgi:hypothetical protein